ncbi:uncharacterized protein LOC141674896 [Apium graveolens]|uniref:uncharacterized protein LOC141674896 n=1 Tax=Apium graveolens TaxID=4045 RepID=UPI003D7B3058
MKIPTGQLKKLDDRSKAVIIWVENLELRPYCLYDPVSKQVRVSRDVVFEEKKMWSWDQLEEGHQTQQNYFTIFGFEFEDPNRNEEVEEPEIPSQEATPTSVSTQVFGISGGDSSVVSSEPRKFRSLDDIYNNTEIVELDYELLLIGMDEPLNYDQASRKKEWKNAMKSELEAVERNETWTLTSCHQVYVSQPEGFVKPGQEHMVYKLHKALYGLRQAPRVRYSKLSKCLESMGLKRCPYEHDVYTKKEEGVVLIVAVYVDDLLGDLGESFDMSDLGTLSYYLGIEVEQEMGTLSLNKQHMPRKF